MKLIDKVREKLNEEQAMEKECAAKNDYTYAIVHRERGYAYGDVLMMLMKEEKEDEV